MATNIQMKQKQADGSYEELYPSTLATLSELNQATKEKYPSGTNNVDEALSEVTEMLDNKANIIVGSYVGTGTYGENSPNSLTFNFTPRILIIGNVLGRDGIGHYNSQCLFWWDGVVKVWGYTNTSADYNVFSRSGNTVSWYTNGSNASCQANSSGTTYQYIAIG